MKFAINSITTINYDFETSVKAFAAAGITHMEFWFDRLDKYLETHELAQAKELLADSGISLISGICVCNLMLTDVATQPEQLEEFKARLALCRDVDCPILLTIPEPQEEVSAETYATAEKNLRSAADVAADYGIGIALEFLRGNKFVGTLSTAKAIIRGTERANVGVVLDLSHFWMDRSDLSDLDDLKPGELMLVHLDDMEQMPPESMTDHDRTVPGRGRGIDGDLIPAIQATGYDGYWSMEIFNKQIWAQPVDRIVAETVRSFEYLKQQYGGQSA